MSIKVGDVLQLTEFMFDSAFVRVRGFKWSNNKICYEYDFIITPPGQVYLTNFGHEHIQRNFGPLSKEELIDKYPDYVL